MSYISCQQQSHDVVFQRNQSQQIQQKTNIYQVMKYPNRNISNVIYLQQQRQQLRVIIMLGCNKPEELILFEHIFIVHIITIGIGHKTALSQYKFIIQ